MTSLKQLGHFLAFKNPDLFKAHESPRYTKALDSIKSLRKDRVAELKTEKAKLDHLAQEKAHADKLKNRISDLNATIAAKEIEYEETRKLYDELVEKNAKFYDWASKFRELYQKVENLQANEEKLRAYYAEAKENVQEIEGSFRSHFDNVLIYLFSQVQMMSSGIVNRTLVNMLWSRRKEGVKKTPSGKTLRGSWPEFGRLM